MNPQPAITRAAALIADPARAAMLIMLVDGRAHPAGELAYGAGVSAPTASFHLAKLLAGGLLSVEREGRHRYYRLAGSHVGQMLESIMTVAFTGPPRFQPRSNTDEPLRHARTCYDHLAGELGVGIADCLITREHVILKYATEAFTMPAPTLRPRPKR